MLRGIKPRANRGHGPEAAQGQSKMKQVVYCATAAALAILLASSLRAAEKGSETNLPIPRFVSLKTTEGNVRRGPSLSHRIDWVFTRRDMPLQIVAEHGNWRRVEDRDGVGGWIHFALLSGVRTVIVDQDMLALHARPDPQSGVVAEAETGVIARLGACLPDWCEIRAGGEDGWVPKAAIWGVEPGEVRE